MHLYTLADISTPTISVATERWGEEEEKKEEPVAQSSTYLKQ